ncbi:S8 family peptidase [Synechococcus sp. Cruz-9H2]|uniref:S8 family peptidase n=1 Tax=unclassified Synechococcus TaxID=2626047 RepID=UPI0020CE2B06|nr:MULTISPECIES: S8 family peptidase [unclassified Synechococcus]MCP9821007.1 S8 family peptidase [Synechococcus sp. Cruz-9H2]MCP9845231.1 S8 family peptidase [Synechococcus sp. Edmonson 11F2]MCP9857402.1 S8 family peptidase [Synechococcus sp. Cruz-9C9]MCP9864658.1 S8 family peptidase [Synechococcus sp. Cruz-7E5]MCP9871928.1 S8 family peptidase [Synechococcus sp. Cruz-7B9]
MTAPKKPSARTRASKATGAVGTAAARTVIYCHGISNMPPEGVLRSEWDRALFGADQGERTRMAYWVDRERYPEAAGFSARAIGDDRATLQAQSAELLAASIQDSDCTDESAAFVASVTKQLTEAAQTVAREGAPMGGAAAKSVEAKGLWSPVTALFTQAFLADANDFLFNRAKRERMVQTVKDRVTTGGGPFVVIGHSQGSMVTYQALMELGAELTVDLFLTIGSPLGLPQVTDVLHKWHGRKLPIPAGVKRWVNIAQDGDIVCLDQILANDYSAPGKPAVVDQRVEGIVWPPSKAHSASRYLSRRFTQDTVMEALDRSRFQPVSPITVARNLADSLDADATARVPVLIELVDRPSLAGSSAATDENPTGSIECARTAVLAWISENVLKEPITADTIHLEDQLERYVSVNLTRAEVETLAAAMGQHYGATSPAVYRMFSNSRKTALIRESIHTVQARTAQLGYNAYGQGITWAVLDTGIDRHHPHFHNPVFAPEGTIAAEWDCTSRGPALPGSGNDSHGHGTHVAGVIAGGLQAVGGPMGPDMLAMAPKARLVTYRVLADNGSGYDAWIIKAIDHIWKQNQLGRRLAIQGVNLSLGGAFDPASFGCGDSPLCASLLRLVRQGVLVVLAAGNEGSGDIVVDGSSSTRSFDLSIGDPANLEEAIAVGSVHPTLPHRYGTSYFSSRGPTADGRLKPDVVGPGERILSCRSSSDPNRSAERDQGKGLDELYIALSGTSMAAPHISGLLAAFLSVRSEFIGYPERVKRILLDHCTDLKRDRYHQGAGLPNLSKMLLET